MSNSTHQPSSTPYTHTQENTRQPGAILAQIKTAMSFSIKVAVVMLLINWKTLASADRQPERSPDDTSLGEIFLKILLPAFVVGTIGYFVATQFQM